MTNPFSIRVAMGRWLGWLVAVCLFNVIIDPPDYSASGAENLDFNEIESICEWILEDVADIENAIAEQDDTDDNQSEYKKDTQFWLTQETSPAELFLTSAIPVNTDWYRPSLPCYITDIISPPPESIS